jgi:osmoprotectant transport system permease protein
MRLAEIAELSAEHLVLVGIAVIAAVIIAAPSAILLTRHAQLRRWTLGVVNILQTIPSLALFGFLLPLPLIGGVGKQTAILALILYALLPILRNMVVGILGVDAGVRESAIAMGMTRGQILRDVEIPLAFPTILAGIRIATVSTIGTATIAAAIEGEGWAPSFSAVSRWPTHRRSWLAPFPPQLWRSRQTRCLNGSNGDTPSDCVADGWMCLETAHCGGIEEFYRTSPAGRDCGRAS